MRADLRAVPEHGPHEAGPMSGRIMASAEIAFSKSKSRLDRVQWCAVMLYQQSEDGQKLGEIEILPSRLQY